MITINDSDFEQEVLKADQPVLVYFWASWCGPCRLMSPIMEQIDSEYGDRLKVAKMEVDPNPNTVKAYQIEGIPALKLVKNSEVVASWEGAMPKQQVADWLASNL